MIEADVFVPDLYKDFKILSCTASFPARSSSFTFYSYDAANQTVVKFRPTYLTRKTNIDTKISIIEKSEIMYSVSSHRSFGRFSDFEDSLAALPFPHVAYNFNNESQVLSWINNPSQVKTYNNWPIGVDGSIWQDTPGISVSVSSRPMIQKRAITKVGVLTLPADQTAAIDQLEKVTVAETPEEIATALAPVVEVVYANDATAGEEDKTYPWIPDITSPLGAIKDVLLAAGKTLTDIKDGILAIPGQITDFFTVDTAQVAVAQAAVSEAFEAKFSALYALSDVFNFKEDFTDVIPVITIAVPDFLQFAFPGQDRIVILDLRPYKNLFDSARTLIAAALWVLFARWVLKQFDVKFGVN